MGFISYFERHITGLLQCLGWENTKPCFLCLQSNQINYKNNNISSPLCSVCFDLVIVNMHLSIRCVRCAITVDSPGLCAECKVTPYSYSRVIAAFDYLPPADLLIHKFKVHKQFVLAPGLVNLLLLSIKNSNYIVQPNLVVVPVPSSRQSIVKRGFNPAAEIAKIFAKKLDLNYKPHVLRRLYDGQKQAHLSREQRMISTAHIYGINGNVQNMHIALIDDVLTTGATLHNIARQFLRAGALSVTGFVLARTPK